MRKTLWSVLTITLKICSFHLGVEGTQSTLVKSPTSQIIRGLPTSGVPQQSSTPVLVLPASNSGPKLCQNVRAVTIPTSFTTPNQKTSWVVSKVTGIAQPQSNLDLSNMNTCSFSSYITPYCKGLNLMMTTAADGKTSTLETYGYNTRTKNLVRFEHKIMQGDDNYLVYHSPEITKMEYISSGGNVEPVTVTEAVKTSQGQPFATPLQYSYEREFERIHDITSQSVPFAIIALEPTFKYAIFQSCDLKTAWVAFSEELVNSQPDMAVLDAYEREIENTLYQNGIDVSTMVDIDFSFHELNKLVMGTNSRPLVGGLSMTDMEKEFVKLICKMIT